MKLQAEGIYFSDTVKDDIDKVWHEEIIFKTDIGTHGILDENFDYGRSIDEKNKFKTELKTISDT